MIPKENRIGLLDRVGVRLIGIAGVIRYGLILDLDGVQYIRDLTRHCLDAKRKTDLDVKRKRLKIAVDLKFR